MATRTSSLDELFDRAHSTLYPLVASESESGSDIEKLMHEQRIAGLQCGAARLQGETWSQVVRSFGVNDAGKEISNQTISQCASLSKPVAASWVIEYCVQNRLNIFETSVNSLIDRGIESHGNDHFEGWRVRGNDGQLLDVPLSRFISHTSGVGGHYVFGCGHDREVQHPLSVLRAEVVDGLPEQSRFEFRCEPGTEMNYSGTSYILLEMLIVHLSDGRPFHEVMADFLSRLEMHASTFDHHRIPVKGDEKAAQCLLTTDYLRFPGAAAGMYTTTSDFLRFVRAVIDAWNGRSSPLSRETAVHMLTAAMRQREFIGLDPGHGFFVIENKDGSITFAHQGANENFRILVIANTKGAAIYTVTNSDFGTPINCQIARRLMDEFEFPGWSRATVPTFDMNTKQLASLAGCYLVEFSRDSNSSPQKGIVEIELDSGSLARNYSGTMVPLHPLSTDGSVFVNSCTGKLYRFDPTRNSIALTDVNDTTIEGAKSSDGKQLKEVPPFDDREYNNTDPAKLVNLQIRDLLNLNDSLSTLPSAFSKTTGD